MSATRMGYCDSCQKRGVLVTRMAYGCEGSFCGPCRGLGADEVTFEIEEEYWDLHHSCDPIAIEAEKHRPARWKVEHLERRVRKSPTVAMQFRLTRVV